MTDQPRKRITINAPSELTIHAARHLDAAEGPVRVGSIVDEATRAAINQVLRYVSTAHNSPAAPPAAQPEPASPSRLAGLRDEIADAVLPVLYREWPWLRAEAEDTATQATNPGMITDPAYLHHLYAQAIRNTPARYPDDIATAVLAVRDRHVEQLQQRLRLAYAQLAGLTDTTTPEDQ